MNPLQIFSIALLVVAVVLSIWRHVNIGTVTLVATLALCVLGGLSTSEAFAAFPASLVLLIIGVTMLFAHAERSGGVRWLVEGAFTLVGGRTFLIPWIGFFVGALLSTIGAFPTAPISLLLPILATLALRVGTSYPLLALICVLGSNAAGFSPLSPAGATIQTICAKLGVTYNSWLLYGIVMGLHIVLVAVLLLLHRFLAHRSRLWDKVLDVQAGAASSAASPAPTASEQPATENRAYRLASLVALVVFVLVVVVFRLDVGLVALTLTLLLQLAFNPPEKALISRVPWNVVLLLSGLVIYFGVMARIGTLKAIETGLGSIQSPVLLILVLTYVTALVSNMESSTLATVSVMVPIGLGALHTPGSAMIVLVAILMSAAVVVMNPVHIAGALIIANAPEERREQMFRNLLTVALTLSAIVPGLLTLGCLASGAL